MPVPATTTFEGTGRQHRGTCPIERVHIRNGLFGAASNLAATRPIPVIPPNLCSSRKLPFAETGTGLFKGQDVGTLLPGSFWIAASESRQMAPETSAQLVKM
jgi:hypothetical protein